MNHLRGMQKNVGCIYAPQVEFVVNEVLPRGLKPLNVRQNNVFLQSSRTVRKRTLQNPIQFRLKQGELLYGKIVASLICSIGERL
jgi:hypothetical protein